MIEIVLAKLAPDENREHEVVMTGREKWKINAYFAILDKLKSEMETRLEGYVEIFQKFDFLVNIIENETSDDAEFILKSKSLQDFYNKDILKIHSLLNVHTSGASFKQQKRDYKHYSAFVFRNA